MAGELTNRRELHPPQVLLNNITEVQTILRHFSQLTTPDQTSTDVFAYLQGEVKELDEALQTKNRGEIAGEIADVLIYTMHLANQWDIHLDIALPDKIARNYHKYNPYKVKNLQDTGMSHQEAISHLKNNWDKNDDKLFCRSCGKGL